MGFVKTIFEFPAPLKSTYPLIWIIPFAVLVAADLYTKKLITDHLSFPSHQVLARQHWRQEYSRTTETGQRQIDILGPGGRYIKFRLVFNDRFAFSLGFSNKPLVSLFVSLFAIVFLFFYRAHNPTLGHSVAWLSIFSGAVGNLIDKMFIKSLTTREWLFSLSPREGHITGVVDFIECIWFGLEGVPVLRWDTWPTFNLADSLVTCGIVLLILTMKFKTEKRK